VGGPLDQVLLHSSAVKAHLSVAGGKGEENQAIGRSRGGRSTKIHALTDAQCRPLAFTLTGGQVADCTAGTLLLEQLPHCDVLHADNGYDANAIRRQVEERGTMPNIAPKSNRKWKNCFSPFLYRNRNAVERMFSQRSASPPQSATGLYQRPCLLTRRGVLRLVFQLIHWAARRIRVMPGAATLPNGSGSGQALEGRPSVLSLAAIRDGMDRGEETIVRAFPDGGTCARHVEKAK
jgi:transposase